MKTTIEATRRVVLQGENQKWIPEIETRSEKCVYGPFQIREIAEDLVRQLAVMGFETIEIKDHA
jgi:hypothetical protein